jgi:hypothetical protein
MRFRHELIHPQALARAEAASWRTPVRATCPLCGQPYYAATLTGTWSGAALEALVVAVQAHLAYECPDHAHSFDL